MTEPTRDEPGVLETDAVLVRALRLSDLEAVVEIDAAATGRQRPLYFERMLRRVVEEADLQASLAAELDDRTVGFVLASLFYGEYGVAEPSASIDTVAVLPAYRGQQVGRALMRQLLLNLAALHIRRVRTEVPWNDFGLLGFFERNGFVPAGRLCLERELDPTLPPS